MINHVNTTACIYYYPRCMWQCVHLYVCLSSCALTFKSLDRRRNFIFGIQPWSRYIFRISGLSSYIEVFWSRIKAIRPWLNKCIRFRLNDNFVLFSKKNACRLLIEPIDIVAGAGFIFRRDDTRPDGRPIPLTAWLCVAPLCWQLLRWQLYDLYPFNLVVRSSATS